MVWPEGAVSKISKSKRLLASAIKSAIRSSSAASIVPGEWRASSSCRSTSLYILGATRDFMLILTVAMWLSATASGSISRPERLGPREVSSFPIRVSKTSPSECAGSVETSSVVRPDSAAISPRAPAVVVFPTPPFPPTKMMRLSKSLSTVCYDSCAMGAYRPCPAPEPARRTLNNI